MTYIYRYTFMNNDFIIVNNINRNLVITGLTVPAPGPYFNQIEFLLTVFASGAPTK